MLPAFGEDAVPRFGAAALPVPGDCPVLTYGVFRICGPSAAPPFAGGTFPMLGTRALSALGGVFEIAAGRGGTLPASDETGFVLWLMPTSSRSAALSESEVVE
jgi:hypothetical protein